MKLSETLRRRGYVHQHSSETLEEITDNKKRTLYLGIDPTADSMHVGHLMGLLVMRRFLEDGHKIVLLTGGGTGMIGDPGGKSEERNLLDAKTIKHNTKAVANQIKKAFGSSNFIEVDNAGWLSKVKLLEFLRDVGKHFTVNAMIKKDIVRDRLEKESPISFTEFSYSLLQGYDFLHLNKEYGCDLQVGGSDQWSNILAGVEYIRRKENKTVYAFTWPLLVNKSTGKKFGKSEGGAVWLDPKKTSPFEFYQFWLNADDGVVEEYLLKMTLLSIEEIEKIMAEHKNNPAERVAQKKLTLEVTTLVHGAEEALRVQKISEVLFGGGDLAKLSRKEKELLLETAPRYQIPDSKIGTPVVDILAECPWTLSKREARTLIESGAISLDDEKITDVSFMVSLKGGKGDLMLLRKGKKDVLVLYS